MNDRIRDLQIQAFAECRTFEDGKMINTDEVFERFAILVIKEHIALLRNEWYELNNAPIVENESLRDVGFRVGRKTEVSALIEKIRKHWGIFDKDPG